MNSYCVHCGKPTASEGSFCPFCGHPKSAVALQQPAKRNGPAIAVVLIISLLLGGIGLYFYSQYAARTAADHAIDAAVSACGGSSQVLAEKVVEAESAIRGLPSEEWGTYQTKLHNRMKFILCE